MPCDNGGAFYKMNNNFWLKLPYDILNDPVIGPMSDTEWRKYMELYIVTAKYGQDGVLPDVKALPYLLRTVTENVTNLLRTFESRGLLLRNVTGTYQLTRYEREQSAIPAATRMQKMRENTKKTQKNAEIPEKSKENSVTTRNGKCYESQEIKINNISNISDNEFDNIWNELFSTNNQNLKNALKRDYRGADLLARMCQWAEAKERGLVDLNDKQLYRRIQYDNDPPKPALEIPEFEPQPEPELSAEETELINAAEVYRMMVASPILSHRPMSLTGKFRPVGMNGKLLLEYDHGILPERHLTALKREFDDACFSVAGIGVELSETTEEAE